MHLKDEDSDHNPQNEEESTKGPQSTSTHTMGIHVVIKETLSWVADDAKMNFSMNQHKILLATHAPKKAYRRDSREKASHADQKGVTLSSSSKEGT